MKTISTLDLKQRLRIGPVALFDVRGDVEFEIGHIPGAGTAPLGSLVFRVVRVMNPDSLVVVYGEGGDCTLALRAARRLEDLGMENVRCYEDGLAGWREAGFPVVESPEGKYQTRGPVQECRPVIVDRERAYGGVFNLPPSDSIGAGG